MFKCQVTNKFSRQGRPGPLDKDGNPTNIPGDKLHKIVVATRERVYTRRIKNEDTRQWEDVEVGRGWEIVREINATQEGLDLWNSWTPEQRELHLKRLDA